MFRKISVKNFRTHTDTAFELGAATLMFGANNAGKSNLLAALRHFSWLTALARPSQPQASIDENEIQEVDRDKLEPRKLRHGNFFPHRHRLAESDVPMSFSCTWEHKLGKVEYTMELYEQADLPQHVACREVIQVSVPKSPKGREFRTGWDKATDELLLRTKLQSENLQERERVLTNQFFRDLASCYVYHFQPSFLKGKALSESRIIDPTHLRIAAQLGYEGGNLQKILRVVQEKEERTFNRFLASLQRFDSSFRTIAQDRERDQTLWLFDLGRLPARFDEFPADVVSDGLLRAAAIAILASMRNPPALILVEEIENGISQRNIGSFLSWLQQAAGTKESTERGFATQFIATSHSSSVLREFADHLDDVYHVRLDKRGYKSVVRNLNASLAAFVDMGIVEAEDDYERDGKRIIKISPEKLMVLWYSGVVGGEAQ